MEYTVDVSKVVSNPELVEAIYQMRKQGTKQSSDTVIQNLLQAQFLAPIVLDKEPSRNQDGTATFKKETNFSFPMLQNAKRETYFMAFTDWEEVYKWNPLADQKMLVFTWKDYVSLLNGPNKEDAAGIVINPFGGNLTLSNSMISAIEKQNHQ